MALRAARCPVRPTTGAAGGGRGPHLQRGGALALLLMLACAPALAAAPAGLACQQRTCSAPAAAWEQAGLSAGLAQAIDDFARQHTGANGYTGAVVLVAGADGLLHLAAHGHQDIAGRQPMQADSIFRIYSMTKTVVSVAALQLIEQGVLGLDDPVARWLPEHAQPQRLVAAADGRLQRVAARRSLTVRHLLTHTAGFASGGELATEHAALLAASGLDTAPDLAVYSQRLAGAPLAAEHGSRFRYDSTSTEVLARLVEVAGAAPLAQQLQTRIFDPLGMLDTGFQVPAAKRARIVELTTMGAHGLERAAADHARQPGIALRPWTSGAGGLYSTAGDFARLARLLAAGGTLDGAVLLQPQTVAIMLRNHLIHLPSPTTEFSDAEGFGLGGAVLLDPAGKGRTGGTGAFGWSGAASTYFSIDPARRLVLILLLQHLPGGAGDLPRISTPYYNLVYDRLSQ